MKDTALNSSASFLDNVLTIKHFFERNDGVAFLFAVCDSYIVRNQVNESVVAYCASKAKTVGVAELSLEEKQGLLTQLGAAKENYPNGLILNNIDSLINTTEGEFAYDFNQMREGLIALGIPLLIWLDERSHDLITHRAIDLYLRRDLSTLFFENPILPNNSGALERFTETTRESIDFENTRLKIELLEQQLREARVDGFSRTRLANEIVLPLIQAYVDNSMLYEAKLLLAEFENEFDYKKTNADSLVGKLFEETGNLDQAISHYEKALQESVNRAEGVKTAIILSYLGNVLRRKGHLERAIENLEKAEKTILEYFNEYSMDAATCYDNLGLTWRERGNLDLAIAMHEKALGIYLRLIGERTTSVANCYSYLGTAWRHKGNLDKSIEYFEKALKIKLDLFGENYPDVAACYNNLGSAWHNKGDIEKSIECLETALRIGIRVLGEVHPDVAACFNNIGLAWQDKGNIEKARECLEKALKIDLKLVGENAPKIIIDYGNIGLLLRESGEFDQAFEYLEKALKIGQQLYGNNNPTIANCYNNLGSIWQDKGELDKAIEYYEIALKIDEQLSSDPTPDAATHYNNLGNAWDQKGNTGKAIEYYRKSHTSFSKLYGADNPTTQTVRRNYDECLLRLASEYKHQQ